MLMYILLHLDRYTPSRIQTPLSSPTLKNMSADSSQFKYQRHGPPPFPQVSRAHAFTAKALGSVLWFWIFYRTKHDYKIWAVCEPLNSRLTPLGNPASLGALDIYVVFIYLFIVVKQ